MSRKIYISAGTSRKIKQSYIGSGNVSRKIKAAYIGIDGHARKFWPAIYKWARYSLQLMYIYDKHATSYRNVGSVYYEGVGTNSGWAFSGVIGAKTMTFDKYSGLFTLSDIYTVNTDYGDSWFATSYSNGYLGYTSTASAGTFDRIYQCSNSPGWGASISISNVSWSSEAIAGNYIEEVASTSQSYPSNGQSGNYWYIYKGTEYRPGVFIDNQYSEDRVSYPDNAASGNYWYIYQGEA